MGEDPRFQVQRVRATLESFDGRPGLSHAYARLPSGDKIHLPTSHRGVIQEDGTIVLCINGNRYDGIAKGSSLAVDLTYGLDGKAPIAKAWAPAQRRKHRPQQ